MKTIKEFMDWCTANPDLQIYKLPFNEWQVVDNWRWAIAANTDIGIDLASDPSEIMRLLNAAIALLGPELLEDIQRTHDEQ